MDLMRFPVCAIVGALLSASLHAQTVSTVAGSGTPGLLDGPANLARFHRPTWLDVDRADGTVYVVDRANHHLRRIASDGFVTTIVPEAHRWMSQPAALDFGGPFGGGIAVEPRGSGCSGAWPGPEIFISSTAGHQLHLILDVPGFKTEYTLRDGASAVIGTGTPGLVDGIQTAASFNSPGDIALSWDYAPANHLRYQNAAVYIADISNNAVRRIRFRFTFDFCPQPYYVDTLASGFNAPRGVAAAPDGSVYVADTGNNAIRRITPDGTVTTVVAEGLNSPSGIDVNKHGEVFIADTGNFVIRKLTTDGQLITIAGVPGVAGYKDGPADTALFSGPIGIRLHGNFLYIADTANNVIRKLHIPAPRRRSTRH
jgi:DNA-binding beta-propeller fold protein YncE